MATPANESVTERSGLEHDHAEQNAVASNWSILVNFVLVGVLCYELHYFNTNVYRFDPWLTFLKPEHLQAAVHWLFGFFLFSVIAAVTKGHLHILEDPRKFFNEEAYAFLSRPRHSALLLAAVCVLFALTASQHTVQLVYRGEGERPVIEVSGDEEFFQGAAVPLFLDANDVGRQEEVVVTDRHNLYRAELASNDAIPHHPVFRAHSRIPLERFFIRRDFRATLFDSDGHSLAALDFEYTSRKTLEEQCAASGFSQHIGGRCRVFFEKIMNTAHANGRYRSDHQGSVLDDERRRFDYDYEFGRAIAITLRAARAQSVLATQPSQAFELYFAANEGDRSVLASEFRQDMAIMGAAELEETFDLLWNSEGLAETTSVATPVRKKAALRFVKEVLSLGLGYVQTDKVFRKVELIADAHLANPGHAGVMVLAVEALVALSAANSRVRHTVLDRVESFVHALGTDHNASKAKLASALLEAIGEQTDRSERDRVVAIVALLRRSAKGSEKEAAILAAVRKRAQALPVGPTRKILLAI